MRGCHSRVDRGKALNCGWLVWATFIALPAARGAQQQQAAEAAEGAPAVVYRGFVVDSEEKPIPDVLVASVAAWQKGRDWRHAVEARTHTDRAGRFELTISNPVDLLFGSRKLYFEHPDYGLAWEGRTSPYALLNRHDGQFRIELQPGVEFGGTVVADEDGNPIAGAIVSAAVNYGDSSKREPRIATTYYGAADVLSERFGRSVVTDAAGRFQLPKLPVGARLNFTVRHPRYVAFAPDTSPASYPVLVDDGQVEIELKPAVTIRGRLLADGKPLEQGGVEVLAIERGAGKTVALATTDDAGRFELTGLDEHEYLIYTQAFIAADQEWIAKPEVIEQHAAGSTVSAALGCIAGQVIAGKVADEDDRPVAECAVSISPVDVAGANNAGAGYRATTDAEGRYRIRVIPGNYRLTVDDWSSGRRQTVAHDLMLAAGDPPATVDFRARLIRRFRRRLVDDEGNAVAGVFYHGFSAYPTDRDGGFSLVARPVSKAPAPAFGLGPFKTICCVANRDKTLVRLLEWSGAEEDLPEEIVVSPPAKVVGRLIGDNAGELAVENFVINVHRPGAAVFQHLNRDFWQLALLPDGGFELSVPTGLPISLAIGATTGVADPNRRRGEFNRWQRLLQPGDLQPGESRDVGEVKY